MREARYDIPPGRLASFIDLEPTCGVVLSSYDELTGGRVTHGANKINEWNQPVVVIAFCRAKHCYFYNAYVVTAQYIGWLEMEG